MITGINHLIFSVRDLRSSIEFYRDMLGMMLQAKLKQAGVEQWKQNTSEGDSVYVLDPNGHRIELHCGTLATRLAALETSSYNGPVWC